MFRTDFSGKRFMCFYYFQVETRENKFHNFFPFALTFKRNRKVFSGDVEKQTGGDFNVISQKKNKSPVSFRSNVFNQFRPGVRAADW